MNREEAIAYKNHLKEMSKGELIKENMSLKRRVDKLSGICNVEDTFRALVEQEQAERKSERLEKQVSNAIESIKRELERRSVPFQPYDTLTKLTDLLIVNINQ